MAGLTLDAGALLAVERSDRYVNALIETNRDHGGGLRVPAGVLAQVWRAGGRTARIARLLKARETSVVPLDAITAKAAGLLCGATATDDVVDASVAACATRHGDAVVTSDPDDIHRLAPKLRVFEV